MTRRERLERKAAQRQSWAASARERSDVALASAHGMSEGIPMGQPILVGHHSERRDRRYRARIGAKFERGFEELQKAQHHQSKASGLELQLERSIFSDDPDAVEQLKAKVAELEASCEVMKAANRAWKKGGEAAVREAHGNTLALQARDAMANGWSWVKVPFSCTSARAEIRRCHERIRLIELRQAKAAQAEAAGGVVIGGSQTWAVVTFAQKPERAVLLDLRQAGYRWGQGSWQGPLSKLPASVRALSPAKENTCHAAE